MLLSFVPSEVFLEEEGLCYSQEDCTMERTKLFGRTDRAGGFSTY
jgi:hypothetical protein